MANEAINNSSSGKLASWLYFGGGLPVSNSQAFTGKELKTSKKCRPKLVLDVPPEDCEKRVKTSRTPLVLKYLRNNWIWHSNKCGKETEKKEKSAEKNLSRKRRADDARTNIEEERDQMRYRRFQDMLRNIPDAASTGGAANEDMVVANVVGNRRAEGRYRRIREDFLTRQLEREETESQSGDTPASSSHSQSSSHGPMEQMANWMRESGLQSEHVEEPEEMEQPPRKTCIPSMAARAMEEESDEQCPGTSATPSTSQSSPHQFIRRKSNTGERTRKTSEERHDIGEEQCSGETEGTGQPPPTKIVRNG